MSKLSDLAARLEDHLTRIFDGWFLCALAFYALAATIGIVVSASAP